MHERDKRHQFLFGFKESAGQFYFQETSLYHYEWVCLELNVEII
jgi:hypothetical protein